MIPAITYTLAVYAGLMIHFVAKYKEGAPFNRWLFIFANDNAMPIALAFMACLVCLQFIQGDFGWPFR